MKTVLMILSLGSQLSLCKAQTSNPETSISAISKIFYNYVKENEGIDSKENKARMEKSLRSLDDAISANDMQLLINVWMYYDPTDFNARELVEPFFLRNKSKSLEAISKRLKNKRENENPENAPYSDLVRLQKRLIQ